jgi:serine/threonine protein kinase/Tol biopolymer transport system component
MSISANKPLGRYEIRSQLGAGGMGEVYLAQDTELRRLVALKVLPSDFTQDEHRLRRFKQEAYAASALNHPNILTIHEIGSAGDLYFIATEFVEGESLRQRMAKTIISTEEAVDIARQVAAALAAAHDAHIVHRDIKPENIMIRRDGIVKVLDFGLVKLAPDRRLIDSAAPTEVFAQTEPGVIVGTVNYMSPEQARGHEVDGRSDIWSLGVVLYEMVTARMPFSGSTASDVIASILKSEPPLPQFYSAEVPAELGRILKKCLSKNPEERYQIAKELSLDLKNLHRDLEIQKELERSVQPSAKSSGITRVAGQRAIYESATRTAQVVVQPTSSAEYLVGQIKRHKTGVALALVIGIAALAGLVFLIVKFTSRNLTVPDRRGAMKIMPLTDTGQATEAVISPDGRLVAYVLAEGAWPSIHLRQVVEPSDREIVAPAPDQIYFGLTFSPDGNYLHYLNRTGGSAVNDLYRVPLLGGGTRRLNHDVDGAVTFAPGGKQFAFYRYNRERKESAVIISDADGANERQLILRKSPEVFTNLAWAPGGQTIAYTLYGIDKDGYYTNVGEAHVADGQEKMISAARWRYIIGLAWLPDESALIITGRDRASSPATPTQIWEIAYPEGEARKLTNDLTVYEHLSVTSDGTTLAATKRESLSNIWVTPANDTRKARQVTNGRENNFCEWTPDGRIVYTSRASGYLDIWIMNSDGSAQKQLTFGTDANRLWSVSADGRYIVFETNRSIGWSIWRMNSDGGGLKELVQNIQQNSYPQISLDSQWVFYSSRDQAGRRVMWRVSIEGGTPQQLTQKDASPGILSPDGKLMFYYVQEKPDAPAKIEIVPATGGDPIKTLDSPKDSHEARWSSDGRSLVYIKETNGVSNLWTLPLDASRPRQLTDWPSEQIFWYAWSRDGKQLAVARGKTSSDVLLIKDFN